MYKASLKVFLASQLVQFWTSTAAYSATIKALIILGFNYLYSLLDKAHHGTGGTHHGLSHIVSMSIE